MHGWHLNQGFPTLVNSAAWPGKKAVRVGYLLCCHSEHLSLSGNITEILGNTRNLCTHIHSWQLQTGLPCIIHTNILVNNKALLILGVLRILWVQPGLLVPVTSLPFQMPLNTPFVLTLKYFLNILETRYPRIIHRPVITHPWDTHEQLFKHN